jgi:hypothetical protein
MCPAARGWQELFIKRLTDVIRRTDLDGFQIDQACGGWCYACYDSHHDHRRPAEAWSGYRPFMRRLREAVRAVKPEAMLWCEGVNDLLGESFDGCQTVSNANEFKGKWEPSLELFRTSVPWALVHLGINGHEDVCTAFALGEAMHCGTFLVTAPDPGFRAEVRAAQELWTRLPPGFWQHPPIPVVAREPGVLSFGYRAADHVVITAAQTSTKTAAKVLALSPRKELLTPGAQGEWLVAGGTSAVQVDREGLLKVPAAVLGAGVFPVAAAPAATGK